VANRAYLFSSDSSPEDPATWQEMERGGEHRYYDSRHGIPLAWFFFFRPHNAKRGEVARCMAGKDQAILLFEQRAVLLDQIVGPIFSGEACKQFVTDVSRQPGKCLCMDSLEVLEDGEEDWARFQSILELIDADKPDLKSIAEAVSHYSRTQYKGESDMLLNVFGVTYA